jgi:hypothetical protein
MVGPYSCTRQLEARQQDQGMAKLHLAYLPAHTLTAWRAQSNEFFGLKWTM